MEQLPVQLREHVLQFQIKAAAEQIPVRILYVVSAGYDSIMTSMSWLPLEQVIPISAANFRQAAQVRPDVHVFRGPAGSGKTHAVQLELQSARTAGKQVVQMSMNEDASSASLIKSLSVLEMSATTSPVIALHISSFAPTSVVNQLLFQLLVEGLVADPSTGNTFALPPNTALLVELAAPVSAGGLVNPSAPHSSPHHVPVVVDCARQSKLGT